jgi:hypothetical protein
MAKIEEILPDLVFEPLADATQYEKEARILNVFDVEVCCRGTKCISSR